MDPPDLPNVPVPYWAYDTHASAPHWSQRSPNWLKANVWAAQYSTFKINQQAPRDMSSEPQRCAACSATVSHKRRCSRCKQVLFCSQRCHRAAWPTHKLTCRPVDEQLADFDLKPDEGLRSACESNDPSAVQMTPDMQRLHDIVYAPEDSDSLQAGLAYLWIGLFWVHANDIPQAHSFFQTAADIGCQHSNWNLQRRALLYQVQTCRHLDLRGATEDMVTCCEGVLRSAQAHEDIHLQAVASHVLGLLKIDSPVRGDKTRALNLLHDSKDLWEAMMRAACLHATGNAFPSHEDLIDMPVSGAISTCASNLVNILIRITEAFSGTKAEWLMLEAGLRVALEYAVLGGSQQQERRVLCALANTLEYDKDARESQYVRDRAAVYRHHLEVAMMPDTFVNRCPICSEDMQVLEASQIADGLEKRINVLPCCWQACHWKCAETRLQQHDLCPVCSKRVWLLKYGIEQHARDHLG